MSELETKKHIGKKLAGALAAVLAFGVFAGSSTALSAAAAPAVAFAAPNDKDFDKQWIFKPFEDPYSSQLYPYTHIDKAWALMPASAKKLRVAVLDNGFDIDHPDLAGNINKSLAWNTFYENRDVSLTSGSGHGTHVAGIFGAVANNGIGIAGIANNFAEIVPIKTVHIGSSDAQTGVTLTETAKGINYAVQQGCKVINISNGTYYSDGIRHAEFDRAIANAISKGVVIVAAAGNGNSTDLIFPSDHASVLSVTSATKTGSKAGYSDHNKDKNIA
ncbi:MAG: S8 family serine peptidase, partial [Propionibacteriaceae bacterium]|nr:S8 family serine peptidase [Propionibacteriaceae bacterium]